MTINSLTAPAATISITAVIKGTVSQQKQNSQLPARGFLSLSHSRHGMMNVVGVIDSAPRRPSTTSKNGIAAAKNEMTSTRLDLTMARYSTAEGSSPLLIASPSM